MTMHNKIKQQPMRILYFPNFGIDNGQYVEAEKTARSQI